MEPDAYIYNQIINTSHDCMFWKDKDRRFVGVNQAFLDYYGFESEEILLGKNDEDMGWHSDPTPFKEDELRVLRGESTYKVQGKCLVHGEERDIIASKRPIYQGDEIVGLVGSFMDVTDVVRRKNESLHAQILYTAEELRRIPYFDQLLDEKRLEEIVDPLTGVISRGYIQDYTKSLITTKKPFTFAILDLDNFKYINDHYGHSIGDEALMYVSKGLADYAAGRGVVGRFGGDELLFVFPDVMEYDDKKGFFGGMYLEQGFLRRTVQWDQREVFVTGTLGCASYPTDARDYETLFMLVDKALYRGKRKGRNCYIIYDDAKYGNMDMHGTAKGTIYTYMQAVDRVTDGIKGFETKLKAILSIVQEAMHLSDLYYVGAQGKLYAVNDATLCEDALDIEALGVEECYADHTLEWIRNKAPILYQSLKKHNLESVLFVAVKGENRIAGYLIFSEPRSKRLWQDDERGLAYHVAGRMTVGIRFEGDTISARG